MKKSTLAIAIGLLLVANTGFAKTTKVTLEQRLEQLESRLEAAESRADQAEQKVQDMQVQQAAEIKEIKDAQGNTPVNGQTSADETKKNAAMPNLQLTGYGDLKIYGDVEFNMDGESRRGTLTKLNEDKSIGTWDMDGRILIGFDGKRKMDNGQFAGFSIQPLADMYGSMNLDDARFNFGQENDWKIEIGRFEAADMFPLNQDTFVEHSGNTANDLYTDGQGYIYMMKEGRGRSDAGGNFLMSKQVDDWYFELNSLIEDGTTLFADGDNVKVDGRTYHGRKMEQEKNVVYLRPVVNWKPTSELSFSAAMEANVVNNAYGYTNSKGEFVDQSDRTGYGLTMTWDNTKGDPDNGVIFNLNTAYLDANNEDDFTAATNIWWKNFEVGYIYAHNKISDFAGVVCENSCIIQEEGTYDIHTVHASYWIKNVMNMQNFNIYLGTYYSKIQSDQEISTDDDRYGARVRFKYYF
ncbi:carbohydrate porin [Kluyvera genomosp. 2]|uniref:carbohydrate porin n=1 Tax=Kluyvera genomosp. 2 TaxID=2774054 RepID=UPI002FD8315C